MELVYKLGVLLGVLACASCSSPVNDVEAIASLHAVSEDTIDRLAKDNPKLKKQIAEAPGYLVGDMKLTKIPVFGGGGGEGVIYAKGKKDVYFRATRVEIGGGWGAKAHKVLIVVHKPEVLESIRSGKWIFDFGGEASVGSAGVEGGAASAASKDYDVYFLSEMGAAATITLRAIRISTEVIKVPDAKD